MVDKIVEVNVANSSHRVDSNHDQSAGGGRVRDNSLYIEWQGGIGIGVGVGVRQIR